MRIGRIFTGVALVCSTAAGAGAQVFSGYNFQLNGSGGGGTPLITSGGVLQLINDQYGSATSAFTTDQYSFSTAGSFTVGFNLHYAFTSALGGLGDVGGDGIAFVMQGGDATALGTGGGDMGYGGMGNSFELALRSFWQDVQVGQDGVTGSLFGASAPFGISSTNPDLTISVGLAYSNGFMEFGYDTSNGDHYLSGTLPVDLSSLGSVVRFGFTGGSGGASQLAEVTDASFSGLDLAPPVTATPEPASMMLVATGIVGLGAFARRRRA